MQFKDIIRSITYIVVTVTLNQVAVEHTRDNRCIHMQLKELLYHLNSLRLLCKVINCSTQ